MRDLGGLEPHNMAHQGYAGGEVPQGPVLVAPGLLSRDPGSGYVREVIRLAAQEIRPRALVTSFLPGMRPASDAAAKARTTLDKAITSHPCKVTILRSSSDEDLDIVARGAAIALDGDPVGTAVGFHSIAPGWTAVCAQHAPPTAYAGRHAIGLARGWRTSIVCLGAPETGVIRETYRRDGLTTELWGIEIGADGSILALIESGTTPRLLEVNSGVRRQRHRSAA